MGEHYLVGDAYDIFEDVAWDLRENPKKPDAFGIIIGGNGSGKSNLAQAILYDCDPTFSIDRIVFENIEWDMLKGRLKRGQGVCFDEGIDFFFARDAMTLDTKDNVKDMAKIRALGFFMLVCIPSLKLLDKYIKSDRPNFIIKVNSPFFKLWSFIDNDEQNEEEAEAKLQALIKYGWNAVPFDFKGRWKEVKGDLWDKYERKKEQHLRSTGKSDKILKARMIAQKQARNDRTYRDVAIEQNVSPATVRRRAEKHLPDKSQYRYLAAAGCWKITPMGYDLMTKRWKKDIEMGIKRVKRRKRKKSIRRS